MIPKRVHTVVISVQHDDNVCVEEQKKVLKEKVIKAVVPSRYLDEDTIYHLQPSGRFVIGGPQVKSREHSKSPNTVTLMSRSMRMLAVAFSAQLKYDGVQI